MRTGLVAILSLLLTTSCGISLSKNGGNQIKGDGNVISKEITINDYSEIDISNVANLIYEQKINEAPYLRVEIDKNLEDLIKVEVKNNKLTIGASENIHTDNYKVYTNSETLSKLNSSGATKVEIKGGLATVDLNLLVSGASELKIDKMECRNLIMNISGAGKLNIESSLSEKVTADVSGASSLDMKGTTEFVNFDASGASKIRAYDLQSENAVADASGASNIEINVSGELKASASGASSVYYKGTPKSVDKSKSGASSISQTK